MFWIRAMQPSNVGKKKKKISRAHSASKSHIYNHTKNIKVNTFMVILCAVTIQTSNTKQADTQTIVMKGLPYKSCTEFLLQLQTFVPLDSV